MMCHGDTFCVCVTGVCHRDVSGDTFCSDVAGDAAFVNNAVPLNGHCKSGRRAGFLFSFSWII